MSDLMDKIGALLLKAERTDNENEREAFLSKAQSLATLASIDLEAARLRQVNKEKRETPISRTITLFDWHDKSKTKSFFVHLILAVGATQDVRFTICTRSNYVVAFGYPSDIDVTEALYASLSQQMVAECEAFLKKGEYKNETRSYDRYDRYGWVDSVERPVDGRTARRSFYTAFRYKIAERLEEAKRETMAEAPALEVEDGKIVSADLVLASKTESVNQYYRKNNNARGSYRGSSSGRGSRAGANAGSSAAARARIGGGASLSGKRAVSA